MASYIALGCLITIACTLALPETAPRLGRWKDLVSHFAADPAPLGGQKS